MARVCCSCRLGADNSIAELRWASRVVAQLYGEGSEGSHRRNIPVVDSKRNE